MAKERAKGCREGEGPCSQRPRKLHKERDSVFWVPSKNRRGGGGKGSGVGGGVGRRETEVTFTFSRGRVVYGPRSSRPWRAAGYPHLLPSADGQTDTPTPPRGRLGRNHPLLNFLSRSRCGPCFAQKGLGWGWGIKGPFSLEVIKVLPPAQKLHLPPLSYPFAPSQPQAHKFSSFTHHPTQLAGRTADASATALPDPHPRRPLLPLAGPPRREDGPPGPGRECAKPIIPEWHTHAARGDRRPRLGPLFASPV